MNSFLNSFFRSIIESITEFLPVSSTGHLFLFSYFFPFKLENYSKEFDDLFDIFIQSGAICSVLILYREKFKTEIFYSLKFFQNFQFQNLNFLLKIIIGSSPIIIVGFFLKDHLDLIKSRNDLLLILSSTWLIGGIIILIIEHLKISLNPSDNLNIKKVFIIGIVQCLALIPGVSRSLSTIFSARVLGVNKKESAEFSFFLAVPVLLLASFYKIYKYYYIINLDNLGLLSIGFFGSLVFSIIVIKMFIGFLKTHSFLVFGYYRIILGSAVFIYFWIH